MAFLTQLSPSAREALVRVREVLAQRVSVEAEEREQVCSNYEQQCRLTLEESSLVLPSEETQAET